MLQRFVLEAGTLLLPLSEDIQNPQRQRGCQAMAGTAPSGSGPVVWDSSQKLRELRPGRCHSGCRVPQMARVEIKAGNSPRGWGRGPLTSCIAQITKLLALGPGTLNHRWTHLNSQSGEGLHPLWCLGFHPKLNTPEGWFPGFLLSHHEVALSIRGQGRDVQNIIHTWDFPTW